MKKLISCILVAMMLFTVAGAFAEGAGLGRFGQSDILTRFVKATDPQTKDIALQIESGDKAADLVIRADRDNLHLVSRNNTVETSHIQMTPTGIYMGIDGKTTLLRYATVTAFMEEIVKELDEVLDEAVKDLAADAQLQKAVNDMSILADEAQEQAQADAATMSAAAMAFAGKFRPENILDVKEEEDSVTISLRSDAFASALADAMDEMMSNAGLADLQKPPSKPSTKIAIFNRFTK